MSGGGGDQAGGGDQGPGPGFDADEELFEVDMIVVPEPDNANDQPAAIKNGDILGNQIVLVPILIDKSTGCCESFQCWVACYFNHQYECLPSSGCLFKFG